jgi:hypothetical protein
MLLNVITQLPDGELEEVTAPLTSPLAHHLCIVREFQEVSGIVDNSNGHSVIFHLKDQERCMR